MSTPEERAREIIDAKLVESGWIIQSRDRINLSASPGVIIREFPLTSGSGYADYMVFVDARSESGVGDVKATSKELVEKRNRWLNPEGADEAELKKRTLTNLYNQRPTWLHLAQCRLDEAVLNAYAWPHNERLEDSANLPDPDVLAAEIIEELQAALEELQAISDNLALTLGAQEDM